MLLINIYKYILGCRGEPKIYLYLNEKVYITQVIEAQFQINNNFIRVGFSSLIDLNTNLRFM